MWSKSSISCRFRPGTELISGKPQGSVSVISGLRVESRGRKCDDSRGSSSRSIIQETFFSSLFIATAKQRRHSNYQSRVSCFWTTNAIFLSSRHSSAVSLFIATFSNVLKDLHSGWKILKMSHIAIETILNENIKISCLKEIGILKRYFSKKIAVKSQNRKCTW